MKKNKFKYPHIKRASDFEDYFSDLFEVLVDFKESLLTVKDKAMVSIVDESVSRSEGNIIKTIEEKLGDNYLLEQRIDDISFLIDKGLYNEALESITVKLTVYEEEKIIATLLDGTEIECEID